MKKYSVAIDGPSGAGKSTVAKAVAFKLGILYVDTGAIYRTIGLYFNSRGIACDDTEIIADHIDKINLKIVVSDGMQRMFMDGIDVSDAIREHHISKCASQVSAIPIVREHLLGLQRNFAAEQSVVMDGRDIGTVVLPNADVKIFLTASSEKRAERRWRELLGRGQNVKLKDVLKDVADRDYADSHRTVAPLVPAKDSIIVDSTNMTLEQTINTIIDVVKEKI